jgi:hypothetical protein
MDVHDWEIEAFVPIDFWISVQSNDDIVGMLAHFFKEVEVADVEQVEGTGNIDDPLAGLGAFAVGKLEKFLCGRQKL